MYSEQLDHLRKGLSDLKIGALLSLLAYVIIILAFLTNLAILPTFAFTFEEPEFLYSLEKAISLLFILILAILTAIVVSLAAFYKFFRATGHFKSFDAPRLGIGRSGVLLQIAGSLIILIGLVVVMSMLMAAAPSAELAGSLESLTLSGIYALIGVIVVGVILIAIGEILFTVMIMRLGEIEGLNRGLRTAGIIWLIGVIVALIPLVSILAFVLAIVALIMVYVYSESSLRSLASAPQL